MADKKTLANAAGMNRDQLGKLIAEKIATELPKQFIAECVEQGIREAITEFRIDSYTVKGFLEEAVKERAKELLKTKYAAEVDKLADLAATQVVGRR